MTAITKFLAGGVAIAALASAAPAAAQYYPGYPGYGYGGGNVVGQVINQVLGGGYGGYGYNGYGAGNSQAAISQCVGAVQAAAQRRLRRLRLQGLWLWQQRLRPGPRPWHQPRRAALERRPDRARRRQQRPLCRRLRLQRPGPGRPDVQVQDRLSRLRHRGRRRSCAGRYGYNSYTPYSNGYDYSQYGYRRY